jgi:hypothetical protein
MSVLDEEVYEGLADLVAGEFFGHSVSKSDNDWRIIPSDERGKGQDTQFLFKQHHIQHEH